MTKSIPKSQFIRIRRICSTLPLYWKHAKQFIKHFEKRGYRLNRLQQVADEIANLDRSDLLTPRTKPQSERIPLVVTYNHKLSELSKILHRNYKAMISNAPIMKTIFPEAPMVAYRRNKSIKDTVIRARHWQTTNQQRPHTQGRERRPSMIDNRMNISREIVNKQNGRKCHIAKGHATDRNVIYAAECKKHNLIYIGMTTTQLNERMNRHRSDITHYPTRSELSKHCSEHGCTLEEDMEISILEHVTGTYGKLKRQEDKWINRLGTLSPSGMNLHTSDFGFIHKSLFN